MVSIPFDTSSTFSAFLRDIKLAHSVFALPFAASACFFVTDWQVTWVLVLKLLVCMVAARSYAMGMNRYLDAQIDRLNPRTRRREIPAGNITAEHTLIYSLIFASVFLAGAFWISMQCGLLGIPLLLVLGFYSYMKRVSLLAHMYLGMCLGFAPIAVSIALTSTTNLAVVFVGVGIMLWTAGFDVLYSLQDIQFDRLNKLHSVPVRFGMMGSVYLSRWAFFGMVLCLSTAGFLAERGIVYFIGVLLIGCLLAFEHYLLIDPTQHDPEKRICLEKINIAFFNVNGLVGFVYLFFLSLDFWMLS